MKFKLTPPPRTVLGVTSQTPFTYLAQVIDLNFVQRDGGETLHVRADSRVCIAGSCKFHTKTREKGEVLIPKPFGQDCSSHKKAHSNATNLFYWGNGNTYSKRHCLMVRHTSINMVVSYRVTVS